MYIYEDINKIFIVKMARKSVVQKFIDYPIP